MGIYEGLRCDASLTAVDYMLQHEMDVGKKCRIMMSITSDQLHCTLYAHADPFVGIIMISMSVIEATVNTLLNFTTETNIHIQIRKLEHESIYQNQPLPDTY